MEFWKFILTWKLISPVQHKYPKKSQKKPQKERGTSLTIMGQRSIYKSIHNPQRSLDETLGFNHDEHLHRTCNETGIPDFLEFLIPGIPMVVIVMSRARSLSNPTQQDYFHARTPPIYKCHTRFKF